MTACVPKAARQPGVRGLPPSGWPLVGLLVATNVAAFLNLCNLEWLGFYNPYTTAAVFSWLGDWHRFFYASSDLGGWLTIDKPPLGFWAQALTARLFGFRELSVLLPQALAGTLSVALLYWLVARVWGSGAGLISALILATTPVFVACNRSENIDSLLVLALVAATAAALRAAETGALRWLLAATALVGVGFNIKMGMALIPLPAMLVASLACTRARPGVRLAQWIPALALLACISFLWVTAVDLTPPMQRPIVVSTTNNRAANLAFAGNGGNRLDFDFGGSVRNTRPSDMGEGGWLRLARAPMGRYIGWFLIPAVAGLLLGGSFWRGSDLRQRFLLITAGGWLLASYLLFSFIRTGRPYQLVHVALPIAMLGGVAAAIAWRQYRRGTWHSLLLPGLVILQAVSQRAILHDSPSTYGFLHEAVNAQYGLAAVLLVGAWVARRRWRPVAAVIAGAAFLTALAAPGTWSAITICRGGTCMIPPPNAALDLRPEGLAFWNVGPPQDFLMPLDDPLVTFLAAHHHGERFAAATTNSLTTAHLTLALQRPVMTLGGYGGADPVVTIRELSHMLDAGQVRYLLLPPAPRQLAALAAWVRASARPVPATAWKPTFLQTGVPGGDPNIELFEYVRPAPAVGTAPPAEPGAAGSHPDVAARALTRASR